MLTWHVNIKSLCQCLPLHSALMLTHLVCCKSKDLLLEYLIHKCVSLLSLKYFLVITENNQNNQCCTISKLL